MNKELFKQVLEEKRLTHQEIATALQINLSSLSRKLNTGNFTLKELKVLRQLLGIGNVENIFFKKYSK